MLKHDGSPSSPSSVGSEVSGRVRPKRRAVPLLSAQAAGAVAASNTTRRSQETIVVPEPANVRKGASQYVDNVDTFFPGAAISPSSRSSGSGTSEGSGASTSEGSGISSSSEEGGGFAFRRSAPSRDGSHASPVEPNGVGRILTPPLPAETRLPTNPYRGDASREEGLSSPVESESGSASPRRSVVSRGVEVAIPNGARLSPDLDRPYSPVTSSGSLSLSSEGASSPPRMAMSSSSSSLSGVHPRRR